MPEKIQGKRNEYRVVEQDQCPQFDGRHEAIISDELWEAVRAMGGMLDLLDDDGTGLTSGNRLFTVAEFESGVPEPRRDVDGRIVWDGTDWSWLPKDGASGGTKNRIVWSIVYLNPGEEFTITYSCGVSGGTSGEPDNRVDVLGVDTAASPLKGGVVVRNEPGSESELPKTGGAGTAPYVVSGFAMALLAGLVLAGRKRRR